MVGKIKEFFRHGVLTNVWLWFHMLFGGFFAYFCKKTGVDCIIGLVALFLIAVLWEVYEYMSDDVEDIYGEVKYFIYDSICDIVGALLVAILILC